MISIERANEILKTRVKPSLNLEITRIGVYKLTEGGQTIVDSNLVDAFRLNPPSTLVLYKPYRQYIDRVIISRNKTERELEIIIELMENRAKEFVTEQTGDTLVVDHSFKREGVIPESFVHDCGDYDVLELRYYVSVFKI